MLTKQELLKMKTTSESSLLSLTKKYNNLSKWYWLPNFLSTRARYKILRKIILEQELLDRIEKALKDQQ